MVLHSPGRIPKTVELLLANSKYTPYESKVKIERALVLDSPSCSWHDSTYIRGWMQMVLSPNDLFSWNSNTMSTMLQWVFTLVAGYARWHLLCAWSFLEVVMGSSSLLLTILSRPVISHVRTQLTLTGPYWGPRPPHPKSCVPFHRICAHSPFRVQNTSRPWFN
jgi:hypothetical protein